VSGLEGDFDPLRWASKVSLHGPIGLLEGMAVNWLVDLQPCEHEQADGNQDYGDWSTHECSLGDKTKSEARVSW
jgi:hypothetical protein